MDLFRKTAAKTQLSLATIVKARKSLSLKTYHVGKQHLISVDNIKKRIDFAKKNKNMNWRQVLFCDETSVELKQCINSKNNIQYATSREHVKPIQVVKHPLKVHICRNIMVWKNVVAYFY